MTALSPLARLWQREVRVDAGGLCLAALVANPPAWAAWLRALDAAADVTPRGWAFETLGHGYQPHTAAWWAARVCAEARR